VTTKKVTTLLAVDDNPDNLFTLRQVIAGHFPERCEVLTAANAEEGQSIAAKTPLDGALIDVQMPGVNGIEMCRRLRADPATANVPVILMTAHGADAALKAQGLEAGAMDFVGKPIDNGELIARIRVMLRIKRAEDDLRQTNEHLDKLVTQRTKELADREHYYRSLIYDLHEDILVIDRNYIVADINNTLLITVGRSREEVLGKHCFELLHGYNTPCDQHGESCPLQEVFKTGQSVSHQHIHMHKDGSKRYVDVLFSALKDEKSQVTRVIAAIRDITEYKQAEEQILSQARFPSENPKDRKSVV